MTILKLIRIVVVFLVVACTPIKTEVSNTKIIYPVESKPQYVEIVKTNNVKKSLAQQSEKQIEILNRLEKESLITPEIKKLRENEKNDVLCLALNMYHEARGSSVEDQIATTYVVFNRLKSSEYPLTLRTNEQNICNIVFDKYQFCWTNGVIKTPKEKEAWNKSQKLALELYYNDEHRKLANEFSLKHYVVSSMLNDPTKPKWINNRKLTVKIGKHSYMAIKEDLKDNPNNRSKVLENIQKGFKIVKGLNL